ncbi:ThiF family adenylyltransferase [Collimonas sp. OK307]|uniref:ThiF family adenylyltransferase n=1 Tax=Collimonas sp. OK307 TaxID=1801620 RepID=UPI003529EA35
MFSARGFVTTKFVRGGGRIFEGELHCTKGAVRVQVHLDDWDFISYPRITLISKPTFLPELMAHVDALDGLCYFSPGSVILNRYDPATAIAQCLDQAAAVLEKIVLDPKYCADDLQDEFLAHWLYGQRSLPWPVVLCSSSSEKIYADYYLVGLPPERKAVIATSYADVNTLAATLGSEAPKTSRCKCWLFRTTIRPVVPDGKMPSTVKEVFSWLRKWDPQLYNSVHRVLEHEKEYLAAKFATFAIDTPIGWLGFGFDLDQMVRLGYRNAPRRFKQYLHGKGGSTTIFRIDITDIRPDFIHSRNLVFDDLKEKRVTLVGCGAIGGYVAQALIRLGAGTGTCGELLLIDSDNIGAENLGRHYLGMGTLFKSKADALRQELCRQFPHVCISVQTNTVRATSKFFIGDLIIDATGEEAVSEMINESHLRQKINVPPVLYVWIKGNGECVQSLFVDSKRYGCFHCLRVTDASRNREDRFPILNGPPLRKQLGCRSFTPYAVSAPMHAASLAIDAVIDWMKGDPSPRFRTRYIENANAKMVKNQNISPLKGCQACGSH